MPPSPLPPAEPETEQCTQLDSPANLPPPPEPEPPAPTGQPWARLVGMGPTAVFGAFDLIEQQVIVGNAKRNKTAAIRIDDPRISTEHCRLFLDGHGKVQLLDKSHNGTWWNNIRLQKEHMRPVSSMDTIVLLHPNPPAGGGGGGGEQPQSEPPEPPPPGVVPRATNYQFMFIDLRPPPAPPPMPMPPPQPQLLRGTSLYAPSQQDYGRPEDYHVIQELGKGSFAVVHKVVHARTQHQYAMKVMEKKKLLRGIGGGVRGPGGGGNNREHYAELQNKVLSEARILRTIDHPNVIRFIDIFETDQHLHLVMELVEGGELFDHLIHHGPFTEPDARHIMNQLLSALKHLHSMGIIHRDLKPENILLQRQPAHSATPDLPNVKIADFGLAKLVGAENKAATFCGTPQYFAPEVLESRNSRRGYDTACDMWSVGVLMYILLSGSPPFNDEDGSSHGGGGPSSQQPRKPTNGGTIFDKIREGVSAAHFEHEMWDAVSPAAKMLICELLVVDPRHRITVDAALNHKWMRGEHGSTSEMPGLFAAMEHRAKQDEIEDSDDEDHSGRRGAGGGGGGGGGGGNNNRNNHGRRPHANAAYNGGGPSSSAAAASYQPPFAKRPRLTNLNVAPRPGTGMVPPQQQQAAPQPPPPQQHLFGSMPQTVTPGFAPNLNSTGPVNLNSTATMLGGGGGQASGAATTSGPATFAPQPPPVGHSNSSGNLAQTDHPTAPPLPPAAAQPPPPQQTAGGDGGGTGPPPPTNSLMQPPPPPAGILHSRPVNAPVPSQTLLPPGQASATAPKGRGGGGGASSSSSRAPALSFIGGGGK